MTSSGTPDQNATHTERAREVVEYLRTNTAFFDQHPEVLRELSIPHASGDAVSLIERQVAALRDESRQLKQQLEKLIAFARENERLNARIHALVLALMNAAGPQAIFECLQNCLREDFGADHTAARIFAEPAFVDSGEVPQFVGRDAPERTPFGQLLAADETCCGTLDAAQRETLFADVTTSMSAVVMPLVARNWDGVLVIASADSERYQMDMGTELLTYLKDVVALVVDPWVKPPRAD